MCYVHVLKPECNLETQIQPLKVESNSVADLEIGNRIGRSQFVWAVGCRYESILNFLMWITEL